MLEYYIECGLRISTVILTGSPQKEGVLGEKRFALRGGKSASLGINVDVLFFGDDQKIRHVRVLMHTNDQRIAEECLNANVQGWAASLEVAVMLETGQPFHLETIADPQTIMVVIGPGDENAPAIFMSRTEVPSVKVDYQRLASAIAWPAETHQHLFYLRRLIDSSLPLDVRWLNGYRLLEWEFTRGKSGLSKDAGWKNFVATFDHLLTPHCRQRQTCLGLLEEARALAAHAGLDARSPEEKVEDQRNAMQKTFAVLERMAVEILNGRLEATGGRIQLQPRSNS